MDRRSFIRNAGVGLSGILGWLGLPTLAWPQSQRLWNVREVLPGDEDGLVVLMRSCVRGADSFHAFLCPDELEWSQAWAEGVIKDRPGSIVITLAGTVVAYFDLPNRTPKTFGEERVDHYQRSFWCGAAGVRADVLDRETTVRVFEHLLYRAFSSARKHGYEFVRAAVPWDQHPYLPRPFAEYPGLTRTPFVDEEGKTKFLQEWRLADAMAALASEGADVGLT